MKYTNIVLNIPHSSINDYHQGWSDGLGLFPVVKQWTDWHTDLLFGGNADPNVRELVFNKSRFHVDVERLVDDPLESIGQGLAYTQFGEFRRDLDPESANALMAEYKAYHNQLNSMVTEGTMVIDCHSFPSDLSDIDICIGFNTDESKPDDALLDMVKFEFERQGYKVGLNDPYSNAIKPDSPCSFSSFMIELNKRTYMDESTLLLKPEESLRVKGILQGVYAKILGCE